LTLIRSSSNIELNYSLEAVRQARLDVRAMEKVTDLRMLFEYWCPMCGTQGLVYALDFQYSKKENHSLIVECSECEEELMLVKPEMENKYVVNL